MAKLAAVRVIRTMPVALAAVLYGCSPIASSSNAESSLGADAAAGDATTDVATTLTCPMALDAFCAAHPTGGGTPQCVREFAAARQCASWPRGLNIVITPSCKGFGFVHDYVTDVETIYLYDSSTGALVGVVAGRLNDLTCLGGPATLTYPAGCETYLTLAPCDADSGTVDGSDDVGGDGGAHD